MKNNLTELVFIIDNSGSMSGYESDTVGGFNSMIKSQSEGGGEVLVSTVFFNSASSVIHDRVKIADVKPMTERDYRVGGSTALLDAIGDAIHHIGTVHKYARPEDVPEKTVFVITTDGMENASHKYSSQKVKELIKKRSEKFGWEFMFLAANIDAVETADSIGIRKDRSANYMRTSRGIEACYGVMADAITDIRKHGDTDFDAFRSRLDEK